MFVLIDAIKCRSAPDYFLLELQNYAQSQNLTLKNAAESILPFALIYNNVVITTILGCLLERPDLITSAIHSAVYREPILLACKAYPHLQLDRQLPRTVTRPQHRLSHQMVELIADAAFSHMLLAHCGIHEFTQRDQWGV